MGHNLSSLRFLHIPKTAGQTLEATLLRQYNKERSFRFTGNVSSDINKFEALSEDQKKNVNFFYGHSTIGTGIAEADNTTIITILRNPVSRVMAFCQHVSEGKSPYLLKLFPPESFNLDQFLESKNPELSNLQTKLLIYDANAASPLSLETLSATESRDLALETLYKKISHIGLQEYFDHSMIIFSRELNWKLPIYRSKNLENPKKLIKFEQRHLDHIAALNKIDMEVYTHAKEHFLSVLNSVPFWKMKLKGYRFANSVAQFAYKAMGKNSDAHKNIILP